MKLSNSKIAIQRRRLRRTETPKAKRIRLLKRYIGYTNWLIWTEGHNVVTTSRRRVRVRKMRAELVKLTGGK